MRDARSMLTAHGSKLKALLLVSLVPMFGCDSFFYYPNKVRYGSPEELRVAYESVQFPSSDGAKLHGWFLSATGKAHGTVLHLHGNAGNITGHFQHVAWLPAAGWNVLCFDYRGYGKSEGRVTRAGTIHDAQAALGYLLGRPDVDRNRIVVFGQSLGGAIGIVLTAERSEVRGLATDGAFDSYRRVVAWHVHRNPLLLVAAWWYPHFMVGPEYDPIGYIGRITPRPVFIMHGTADQVVDPRMARTLYDAAGEPKELWMVEGADHYGAMQDDAEEAHARLLRFFGRCVGVHSP
jgi:uncharacterized protein